jgi:glycerol transport system ATP-binding protein
MGRGLVRPDVAAVLFDEPLTTIDQHLKWTLRRKLKQIHAQLKLSLIYVTHDQVEAMTFADQVVVMYSGEVVQLGTPQDLFEHPAHTFVGFFVGSPGMNLMPCSIEGGTAIVGDARIPLDPALAASAGAAGGKLTLGIRPEFVELTRPGAAGSMPSLVERVEDLGSYKIVTARLGGQAVMAKVSEDESVSDATAHLRFPPQWTRIYADDRAVA